MEKSLWIAPCYTVVWEKFAVKNFLSAAFYDENLTHEIFLP